MDDHSLCHKAFAKLHADGNRLYFTLQNAAEFWNVSARSQQRNGHGFTPSEASLGWRDVEEMMVLLPDTADVYEIWRDLVTTHNVLGVLVHDAKLTAAMLAHGIRNILTFNIADFVRFRGIEAIHPARV